MVIHDRSYARWDGDRSKPVRAAWIIMDRGVTTALAQIFKRKLFGQLLSFWAFGPFLFAVGLLYASFYLRSNLGTLGDASAELDQTGLLDIVTPSAQTVFQYYLQVQVWVCLVLSVIVGSGLIAEDRRVNALEMYLSRPLAVWQYVLGKLSIMAFFLALITVAPVCLLILLQAFLTGFEGAELARLMDLAWRSIAAGTLFVGVLSLLILATSALSNRARNASILWIGFIVMLEGVLYGNLQANFLSPTTHLVSVYFNISRCMAWILDNQVELALVPELPVVHSAIVLGGWCALCLTVLLRRVRPVEIVA
jgi:ABC-2 type transport system permease protein